VTEPIKWNKETEEWEYRCEECIRKGMRSWWPLTFEFWNPTRGMNRCLACQAEHKARQQREKRRANPEYRRKCVEQTRELRKLKGRIYDEQRTRSKNKKVA
jgi:hypothetical protein